MKRIIYGLALIAMLTSCAKGVDYLVDPSASGLSGTSWRKVASVSVIEKAGTPTYTRDDFADYLPCEKDDVFTYKANGIVTFDNKDVKCFDSDPQIEDQGTWKLSTDGKILTIAAFDQLAGVFEISVNLLQLDATTLKYKFDYTFNGEKTTTTDTFVKVN